MSLLPSVHASLERVCLHEHAHWRIARALGACGFVRIRRLAGPATAPARYAGTFQMHGELGEREWRVVALAGTIAEWLHDAPTIAIEAVLARLATGTALSPEDARLAHGYDREDVARCLATLREHWAPLLGEVADEIEGIARLHGGPEPAPDAACR